MVILFTPNLITELSKENVYVRVAAVLSNSSGGHRTNIVLITEKV